MLLISYGYVMLTIILILIILSLVLFVSIKPINALLFKNKLLKKLKSFISENKKEDLFKYKNMPYDYMLILRKSVYYIRLISNINNYNVHYEDSKFYYRDKKLKKNTELNIESFIKFAPEEDKNRDIKKLLIVYPNCDFIYNHLDKNNSLFVYIDDEIGGIHIIGGNDFINLEEII